MKKLVRLLKAFICVLIFSASTAYAERFDFENHALEFIDGHGVIVESHQDREQPVKHWIIIFKDGCTVEFLTDLDDTDARCWRWVTKRQHGRKT